MDAFTPEQRTTVRAVYAASTRDVMETYDDSACQEVAVLAEWLHACLGPEIDVATVLIVLNMVKLVALGSALEDGWDLGVALEISLQQAAMVLSVAYPYIEDDASSIEAP